MYLGSKIQNLRKSKSITQEDLAAELGVTAAAVSKWENDYTLPDIIMLCAIADYFEITTDELLGREKEFSYAVIASENITLGKKVEEIAKKYSIKVVDIINDYKQASELASKTDNIKYLIACYISSDNGFYDACPNKKTLIAVSPTEDEILSSIKRVFDEFVK